MPWVYTLQLSEFKDAAKIQSDWEAETPGGTQNQNGGVQVSGTTAAIVSTRRNPEYENMQSNLSYVDVISEDREIPTDGVYNLIGDFVR